MLLDWEPLTRNQFILYTGIFSVCDVLHTCNYLSIRVALHIGNYFSIYDVLHTANYFSICDVLDAGNYYSIRDVLHTYNYLPICDVLHTGKTSALQVGITLTIIGLLITTLSLRTTSQNRSHGLKNGPILWIIHPGYTLLSNTDLLRPGITRWIMASGWSDVSRVSWPVSRFCSREKEYIVLCFVPNDSQV